METFQYGDCENAFFLADLADVVRKYERWTTLLPRVEPFYGDYSSITFSLYVLFYHIRTHTHISVYIYIHLFSTQCGNLAQCHKVYK